MTYRLEHICHGKDGKGSHGSEQEIVESHADLLKLLQDLGASWDGHSRTTSYETPQYKVLLTIDKMQIRPPSRSYLTARLRKRAQDSRVRELAEMIFSNSARHIDTSSRADVLAHIERLVGKMHTYEIQSHQAARKSIEESFKLRQLSTAVEIVIQALQDWLKKQTWGEDAVEVYTSSILTREQAKARAEEERALHARCGYVRKAVRIMDGNGATFQFSFS